MGHYINKQQIHFVPSILEKYSHVVSLNYYETLNVQYEDNMTVTKTNTLKPELATVWLEQVFLMSLCLCFPFYKNGGVKQNFLQWVVRENKRVYMYIMIRILPNMCYILVSCCFKISYTFNQNYQNTWDIPTFYYLWASFLMESRCSLRILLNIPFNQFHQARWNSVC